MRKLLSGRFRKFLTPLKSTLPIFWQAPLFRQFLIYILFCDHPLPPAKNWWIPITLTFFIFITLSYLLKVTEFLVKICQFKFLVMADKHFGLYFLLLLLFKNSDFSLFFMQQLRSIPPPAQKESPLLSQQPPSKNWDPSRFPLLKIW